MGRRSGASSRLIRSEVLRCAIAPEQMQDDEIEWGRGIPWCRSLCLQGIGPRNDAAREQNWMSLSPSLHHR